MEFLNCCGPVDLQDQARFSVDPLFCAYFVPKEHFGAQYIILLKVTWDMGFRRVCVESDSEQVVMWLNERDQSECRLGVMSECRSVLRRQWDVVINHVYREANRVTDALAAKVLYMDRGLYILHEPPPYVRGQLLQDETGLQ